MRRAFQSLRDWHRPRSSHSLVDRWLRDLVLMLLALPVLHLFWRAPWYDGIGTILWMSFCYALAEYGYFHVYGGTDEHYPNLPEPKSKG
jgi:hypothetical protein